MLMRKVLTPTAVSAATVLLSCTPILLKGGSYSGALCKMTVGECRGNLETREKI